MIYAIHLLGHEKMSQRFTKKKIQSFRIQNSMKDPLFFSKWQFCGLLMGVPTLLLRCEIYDNIQTNICIPFPVCLYLDHELEAI